MTGALSFNDSFENCSNDKRQIDFQDASWLPNKEGLEDSFENFVKKLNNKGKTGR